MSRWRIESFGWGATLAFVVMLSAGSVHAEFPPEGAVADPGNPSKADKISIDHLGKTMIKAIDHYYYDCLKKKWVWVSRDLWRKEGNGEDEHVSPGHWTKDDKWVPGSDAGHADLDSSPKPPGATKPGDTPDEAFDPKTSTTYKYDHEKDQWIDKFTGQVVSHKLCPPCPPTETPLRACPEKTDSGSGLNLGIGIGIGGSSGHHESHSHHGDEHKARDEKSEEHLDKEKSDHETHEEKPKSGGCGPH